MARQKSWPMPYAITTKYLGPTDTKGGRIVARHGPSKISVPWDHSINAEGNHIAAAHLLKRRLGYEDDTVAGHSLVTAYCEFETIYVHIDRRVEPVRSEALLELSDDNRLDADQVPEEYRQK